MMNEFFENLKVDLKAIWKQIQEQIAKITGKPIAKGGKSVVTTESDNNYEINLVPEVKMQMIKALKMRNLVLFICIVVSSAAFGVVLLLFGIKSGQDIAMSNQDKKLERMSNTLTSYSELEDLVTIQDQLARYQDLVERKTVLSRVFGALGVMLPQGEDEVKMSELRVNLDTSVVNLEGQADAKVDPLIDYRVLEAFKKSVDLTKYDYGRYVDIDGKELPTQCIDEADEEGNAYRDGENYYAWWDLTISGCEGSPRSLSVDYTDTDYHYSSTAEVESGETVEEVWSENEDGDAVLETITTEKTTRVKIWRTPQFAKWYEDGEMSLDGSIYGIEHFESMCYSYTGTQIDKNVRWNSENNCLLAEKGLKISGSSNGRDESDNLVLRFTASVTFAEEFFAFANKHMIAIGPMGQNVTDSYVQIGNMFAQEATACEKDDTECLNNSRGN